ncbi:Carboxypeptidase T [Phycisphaerales bacterium]|nr:Carboxypeptidase T [Phycisphaerales bacterium]
MKLSRTFAAMTALACSLTAPAQEHIPAKVEIPFNRYYRYAEMEEWLRKIAAAYPEIVELRNIGKSLEGRDLWVAVVNNPRTGPDTSKPAMWIDGNVHGNEIQAGEATLYSLWYLTKAQGHNADLTKLLDNYSFYFLVSQNPDGREHWFMDVQNSSSSRSNRRPVDNDRDGALDEDRPDDLDGDGSITQMWKQDPNGRWLRDRDDPRIFTRVADDKKGEWTNLGSEGIDNDGDGQINEDGPGGDDMNRNWPSDWLPDYVQGGAGLFPFSNPEPRAIGAFILAHPNIAAVQSYHNAGGMILRGPGASYREGIIPGEDLRVYDEIGRNGEVLLPYYRYMIIYRDLYTVHGGFVNWTAEGLGVFSFTNELWSDAKYFQRDGSSDDTRRWLFRDRLQFGQTFTPYKEFDHPQYGKILIGGLNKWSSRVTPTFMLEEECHRNFGFTMYHADQMPIVSWGRTEVTKDAAPNTWIVTLEVRNEKLMPTRSGLQRQKGIGVNDILTVTPPNGGSVDAAGFLSSWQDTRMDEIRHEPARVQLPGGIPGRGGVILRFYVSGREGEKVVLKYTSEKAKELTGGVVLR